MSTYEVQWKDGPIQIDIPDKNLKVGLLHDFHRIDEEPHPIRAEMHGFVMAQAWRAPVAQGQFVLLVGREIG